MKARVLLLVAFVALLAGCNAVTPYAAQVNGERITVRDLDRELKAIRGNEQYLEAVESELAVQGRKALGAGNSTFDSSFVSQVLTRRILLELVHQEVRDRKLRIDDDARVRAREQLEQSFGDPKLLTRFPKAFVDELVQYTAEIDLLQVALRDDVSAEDVRTFYDENPDFFVQLCYRESVSGNFESPEVTPEQEAQAKAGADQVKRRVDGGEDFAAIGQDKGCVPQGSVPPTLTPALTEMQPGEVRGPIRTDTGFHVVQLVERKKQPVEEAEPQIRMFLERQSQQAFDTFLQEEVQKAKITVNPRYGTFDKAGPAVVPPQAPPTTAPPGSVPAEGEPPVFEQ
ncbi:MAG: peptidyl-prolyl cis-trans isomerase [Actinomycetota bacterium]|nr:peptidyl-prolyl cis-trans isomerase [Actinomycetota bacterium]